MSQIIKDYELPDIMITTDEPEREALSLNIFEAFAAGTLIFRADDGKEYSIDLASFWHKGNILSVYKGHFGATMFDEDGQTVEIVPPQSMDDIRQRNNDLGAI